MTAAFPLSWPPGWPRTEPGMRADGRHQFRRADGFWSFTAARDELFDEVRRLRGSLPVISSNFTVGRYGEPVERGARPADQGIAVYFTVAGQPRVMARDAYLRAEENMRSLTLSIAAMRQLARHGGGRMMERAFEGFAALPAPEGDAWHEVLEVPRLATVTQIEEAHRELAKKAHPDVPGGSTEQMARINVAKDAGLKERGR